MIICPIELHSARTGQVERKATLVIDRQSNGTRRDYRARLYPKGAERDGLHTMIAMGQPFRQGMVRNHPADQVHTAALVAKALGACGFDPAAPEADLFETASRNAPHKLARSTDPAPSRRAAEDIAAKAQPLEREVMGFALRRADFTQWELEEWAGDHSATYRSRVAPLVEAGYLIETDRTRTNGNGREVTVYTAQGAKPWPHPTD